MWFIYTPVAEHVKKIFLFKSPSEHKVEVNYINSGHHGHKSSQAIEISKDINITSISSTMTVSSLKT